MSTKAGLIHSPGVIAFDSEFSDGMEVLNVVGRDVYGNGVILSRSPNSLVDNVRMFNVSAGNPGAADSTGGGISIMRGSQVGTLISHGIGINTRQYKTDTIAGFNTITAKNTLCGYIGVWTEYGIDIDGITSPGAELWGKAEPKNGVSFGCRIENCMVFGYTLGFKLEGHTPAVVDSCMAVNCWIPFIGAATQGRIVNCCGDSGDIDKKQCPQSGYEYVRGLFVHYNVSASAWSFPGFKFDGCMGFTRKTRINVTNCGDGSFLNQQVVIDHAGAGLAPSILETKMLKVAYGLEISGTYIIRGLGESRVSTVYDMKHMKMDVTIINLTDKLYTVNAQAYVQGGGCDSSKIHVWSRGLVKLSVNSGLNTDILHVGRMVDIDNQFETYPVEVGRNCLDAKIVYDLTLHSAALRPSLFGPSNIEADFSKVDGSLNLIDAGSNTIQNSAFINSRQSTVRLRKSGDVYNIPLIKLGASARGIHIAGINSSDDAPLFDIGYGIMGPITFNDGVVGLRRMTLQTLQYEPNHPDRLTKDIVEYMPGLTFNYLRSSLGAASGCKVFTGGRRAAAWVASSAVTLNAYRATETNVYQATTAGTTGTIAPDHLSGAASDGTVVWTWVAPFARFVELAKCDAKLM